MSRKDLLMQEVLINTTETAVANYIINRALDFHIDLTNLELGSIMAVLEGKSLSEHNKSLCHYDTYFKYGTMYQIILPNIYAKFRDCGSEPITFPYEHIISIKPEIKSSIPSIKYKDADEKILNEFFNNVLWCLFYHRITGEVVMPTLKKAGLKADSSYIDEMPHVKENTLVYMYEHNWSMIQETGSKLAQSYKSDVQSGFPPEIINESDGQDLIESFRQYYSTVDDTPTGTVYGKFITLFNQAYQLGKHKKDLSDLKFSNEDESFTDILNQAYKLGKEMREWQDFLNYDDDEDCF